MKYRKRPAEVEAFRLTSDVDFIAPDWFTQAVADEKIWIDRSIVDGHVHIYGCTIQMPEGRMHAKLGDYIIRDADGRIYPCKSNVFKRDFEKAG